MKEIFAAGLFLGLFDVLGIGDEDVTSGGFEDGTPRGEDPFYYCDAHDDGTDSSWEEGDCWD